MKTARTTSIAAPIVFTCVWLALNASSRFDFLAGARVEETRLTGRGVRREITPEERARRAAWVGTITPEETRRRTIAEWSNIREEGGRYRNVLPSLHCRYNVSANLLARASYSTGIGRPNFSNLLRTTTVNHDTMRVVAANPDLKPQTTDNFDLSAEYYFEPAGYFSVGVFLKEIKDFIYGDTGGTVGAGPDNGFEGQYEGYTLTRNANGGSGRVRGFEIAYHQRFHLRAAACALQSGLQARDQGRPLGPLLTMPCYVSFRPDQPGLPRASGLPRTVRGGRACRRHRSIARPGQSPS